MGQTCIHKDLSTSFNFKTSIQRLKNGDHYMDSSIVKIAIINKSTLKTLQTIKLNPTFLFSNVFQSCKAVRSYLTKKNINIDALDNDYGDFIVADFNFDSKEDIAIKKDSGGNAGPLYDYYVQDNSGRFVRNIFLSEEMEFFPAEINKKKKTLVTYLHAGVCGLGEHVYSLNTDTNKWHQRSHRIINICKD